MVDNSFEVIEEDLEKQLDDDKKHKKLEVRVLKELYTNDVNEVEIFSNDVIVLDMINTTFLEGKLILTGYKLVFLPYSNHKVAIQNKVDFGQKTYDSKTTLMKLEDHRERYFKIPIHMIYSIKDQSDKKDSTVNYIDITTKDYRSLRIKVNLRSEGEEIIENIKMHTFTSMPVTSLFMFKYKYQLNTSSNDYSKEEIKKGDNIYGISLSKKERIKGYIGKSKLTANGWDVYNYKREFERQGITKESTKFRDFTCWSPDKEHNTICGTYPQHVYVPQIMTDEEVKKCSMFRTKHRFPALSYYYKHNETSIWRGAQNQLGIMNSRSSDDEKGLKDIGDTNKKKKQVVIVDARSLIAAQGNRARGGGFELEQYYTNCKLIFASIDNIHAVRDAYKKCFSLCENYFQTRDNKKILSKIEGAGWTTLLKNILSISVTIADILHNKNQIVVVHGSDGWDRTAQLGCVSEILLDPYYRTLEGFEVLIEKEWVSFGHRFKSRCGHFESDSVLPDERSPVFIQFLDGVFQLLHQFPTAFQFNSKLLLFLAHHVYTCKFGTFIFDNERSRYEQNKSYTTNTVSIWTYINDNCYDFLNPFYIPSKEVLEPNGDYVALEFWKDHFLTWSECSEYKPNPNGISASDHKEEFVKGIIEENMMLKKRIKQLKEQLKGAKNELSK